MDPIPNHLYKRILQTIVSPRLVALSLVEEKESTVLRILSVLDTSRQALPYFLTWYLIAGRFQNVKKHKSVKRLIHFHLFTHRAQDRVTK